MQVELEARTQDPGTTLRAPTVEAGFSPTCRDTCFADLKLKIWDKKSDGSQGNVSLSSPWHHCFAFLPRILHAF